MPNDFPFPSLQELRQGYEALQANERRDAMYVTASFLVEHFWNEPAPLANGLGVLLLTWNQALYRYGAFDFERLERYLRKHADALHGFRHRHILDATADDEQAIGSLFFEACDVLAIADGKKKGTRSPVAAAKALHLLAPSYFPLWDDKIARAYRCHYSQGPECAYVRFFRTMQRLVQSLPQEAHYGLDGKTALKLIDEFNYAKFTKGWV